MAVPRARGANEPAGWLILADSDGVGSALADMLRQSGEACRLFHLDDTIERASGQTWRSVGDLRNPFAALVAELADQSKPRLRGIVDLWALDVATGGLTVDQLEVVQKVIVGGALSLLQAVIEARGLAVAAPRIWFVSRNAISVLPDDPPAEAASAASGASAAPRPSNIPRFGVVSSIWALHLIVRRRKMHRPSCVRLFMAMARIRWLCGLAAGL